MGTLPDNTSSSQMEVCRAQSSSLPVYKMFLTPKILVRHKVRELVFSEMVSSRSQYQGGGVHYTCSDFAMTMTCFLERRSKFIPWVNQGLLLWAQNT